MWEWSEQGGYQEKNYYRSKKDGRNTIRTQEIVVAALDEVSYCRQEVQFCQDRLLNTFIMSNFLLMRPNEAEEQLQEVNLEHVWKRSLRSLGIQIMRDNLV